jgi:hypothetical protein
MSAIANAVATMDDGRLPGSDLKDPIAHLDLKDRWRDGPLEVSDRKLWETFLQLHKALLKVGLATEVMTRKAFFIEVGEMVEFGVADTQLGYSMKPLRYPRLGTYERSRVRRGLGLRSDDEIAAVIAAVSAHTAP